MARQGDIKSRASGRASITTPPVRFLDDDRPGQLSRKNVKASSKTNKPRGFTRWLLSFASRVTIFYLIYAALWTCPSRPFAFDYSAKDARPVCRNLAQAHNQIVPIIKPYFHLAQQKVEPYSRPVVKAAAPWVRRANKVSRPIYREAEKRGRLVWKKRIDPARRRAVKRAQKQIDPYLRQAHHYHKHNVQPHIDTVHKAVKPYHDIYQRDISPYVDQAYQYSLQYSSVSYAFYVDKVHPHVVQSIKHVYSFLVNHVSPAVRRFYSVYVRPQLDRLLAKAYERKAHWLGSDAIKAAQQETAQTAKEADEHAQQAVKQAEQDAIRARNDPSLLDRVKQAKDSVYDSATGTETDSVKVAQLDAELEAEEAKVKDLLEVWEKGMTNLVEEEYQLAVKRIAELRNTRLTDLPDRFGLINEAFVEDTVALILNRVERGLRKIAARHSDTDKQLKKNFDEGNKLVDQQLAKFDRAGQETKAQIAAYYEELLQQERQTIEASSAEVRRYAEAAKDAYDEIMRNAKFSVTMDEWHGWDMGVRKRAALFAEELLAVQSNKKAVSSKSSGAIDLRKDAPDMQKEVNSLRSFADKLHFSARKELIAYCDGALAELAGDGIAAKISDITDRLAEQASRITTDATAGMLAAVGSARSKMGLGEVVDEGYFARAKAYVASGTGSGSSFDDYVSSFNAKAAAAGSSVSSAAAQASSSVASAVGGSSSPAAAAGIAANVKAAASSASSVASQASRSVASAVGASPTPETLEDYLEVAKDSAEAATSRVAHVARSAASSASSAASAASSAAGLAADNVGEAVQSGASSVSSAASVASKSASSAAGNVGQAAQSGASSASSAASVASRSVSSAVQSGASSVSAAASMASKSASSALNNAGTAAQSGASSVSLAASVASRSANSALDNASAAARSAASSASSVASVASNSVSSASVVASDSAFSAASVASRSVASALGASPSPNTFKDHVEMAQDNLSAVAASGSSVVSKASRSVASAVGASPSAETWNDLVGDVKDKIAAKVHVEL